MSNRLSVVSRIDEKCDYGRLEAEVFSIDPNKGRCLVENTENTKLCHVLPRRLFTDNRILDRLEYVWNLKRGDLNLDSPYNVFPASDLAKETFEKGQWLLVPTDEFVDSKKASRDIIYATPCGRRARFPGTHKQSSEYRVVPVYGMEDVVFKRWIGPSADDFSIHRYPFDDLVIVSHIRPEYAIAAIGDYFHNHLTMELQDVVYESEHLELITRISLKWSFDISEMDYMDITYTPRIVDPTEPPPGRIFAETKNDASSAEDSEDEYTCSDNSYGSRTPPRRIGRRKRTKGSRAGVKRRGEWHRGGYLSEDSRRVVTPESFRASYSSELDSEESGSDTSSGEPRGRNTVKRRRA